MIDSQPIHHLNLMELAIQTVQVHVGLRYINSKPQVVARSVLCEPLNYPPPLQYVD